MDVIYAHVYFSEVKTFAVAEKRTESCPRCQCSGLQYFLTPSVHLITSTLKFLSRRYIDESFSKPILEVLLYTNCNGSNTKNNSCQAGAGTQPQVSLGIKWNIQRVAALVCLISHFPQKYFEKFWNGNGKFLTIFIEGENHFLFGFTNSYTYFLNFVFIIDISEYDKIK